MAYLYGYYMGVMSVMANITATKRGDILLLQRVQKMGLFENSLAAAGAWTRQEVGVMVMFSSCIKPQNTAYKGILLLHMFPKGI